MKKSISFVLPALNEELLIEKTVNVAIRAAKDLDLDYEIIIIDDGSTDATYQIATSISLKLSNIIVKKHPTNLGLGGAYKSGISLANNDWLILLPADDAWPLNDLKEILLKIGEADIVIPYIKTAGDKSRFRKILSKTYTNLINILFGLNVPYYNGIVIHKTNLLKKIQISSNDFSYQTEVLIKLLTNGASFVSVGANTNIRNGGKSKALKFSNIVNVIFSIILIYYKVKLLKAKS